MAFVVEEDGDIVMYVQIDTAMVHSDFPIYSYNVELYTFFKIIVELRSF